MSTLSRPVLSPVPGDVLYCDVDGTLVSDDNRLSSITSAEIHRFVEAGFGFSLATGRSYKSVERFLQELPITAPLVLCNGAYIYDPVSHSHVSTPIESQFVNAIVPVLLGIPGVWVYMDTSDRHMWVSHRESLTEPFVTDENLHPRVFSNIYDLSNRSQVLKIGVKITCDSESTKRQLQRVIGIITAHFARELHVCFSSDNYVELMAAGVSKWFGIQVSQSMKVRRDNRIFTIGDHFNDIEMISEADVGIAMANAVEEIKQAAMYSIGHVKNHAVAAFLKDCQQLSVSV
ncbi:Cof-type HAD-IIB family hydrolase [Alicyclobacillus sp. SO9]|uniref:Cof-type HAD-IIB family hydrolase n=1 Tax=Alicyclobacillus sp. SO9 TaxID=2665646 RepID=UPI0018E7CEC2|nr:Cof-type HAD-IIB family hydrolase [Alicyclobacillus sp. SO9]QQE79837.1 Cof-type HAD-IIB family hydrolase [Alicyclobacillus sp. SO9]